MKKLFTFLLAIIAGVGTLFAQSGTCGAEGDNLTWDLTGGVLTVSGTGAMVDWTGVEDDDPSWMPYRTSILSVVINEGVTGIGSRAFQHCLSFSGILHIPFEIQGFQIQICALCLYNGSTSVGGPR